MNSVIARFLVDAVSAEMCVSAPEFAQFKSGTKGGGRTFRWKVDGVLFYVVLHFVRDRDDIHLDLCWSKNGSMPSEQIWYESSALIRAGKVTIAQMFRDSPQAWLRPEDVDSSLPSSFRLEHDHPPHDRVKGILNGPQAESLREAFPTFDALDPGTFSDFGWDLLDIFGDEVSLEDAAYAVGKTRGHLDSLLTETYIPLVRALAGC